MQSAAGGRGEAFDINPMEESLVNPRNLNAGAANLCLTDDNGLHCGGMTVYKKSLNYEPPEDLADVTLLTGGGASFYTCGLADEWVCWGDSLRNTSNTSTINQKIMNPIDISISTEGVCVAGDEGVLCENTNPVDPPFYLRVN